MADLLNGRANNPNIDPQFFNIDPQFSGCVQCSPDALLERRTDALSQSSQFYYTLVNRRKRGGLLNFTNVPQLVIPETVDHPINRMPAFRPWNFDIPATGIMNADEPARRCTVN